MLKWMLNPLCKVGWHYGSWGYDSGTVECAQTLICRGCGEQSSRIRHEVDHWDSGSSEKESAVCIHCKQIMTRKKPGPWGPKGPM